MHEIPKILPPSEPCGSEQLRMSERFPISKWRMGILAHDCIMFLGQYSLQDELSLSGIVNLVLKPVLACTLVFASNPLIPGPAAQTSTATDLTIHSRPCLLRRPLASLRILHKNHYFQLTRLAGAGLFEYQGARLRKLTVLLSHCLLSSWKKRRANG